MNKKWMFLLAVPWLLAANIAAIDHGSLRGRRELTLPFNKVAICHYDAGLGKFTKIFVRKAKLSDYIDKFGPPGETVYKDMTVVDANELPGTDDCECINGYEGDGLNCIKEAIEFDRTLKNDDNVFRKKDDLQCVTLLASIEYEWGTDTTGLPTERWDCELLETTPAAKGEKNKILEFEDDLEALGVMLEPSDSGSTLMTVHGGRVLPDGKIKIDNSSDVKLDKKDKGNSTDDARNLLDGETRRLALTGSRNVIAIRVKDTAGHATASSAATMSTEIFGKTYTGTDNYNLPSMYKACSYDKSVMSPVTQVTLKSGTTLTLPYAGVFEVTISDITGKADNVVRDEITAKLNSEFAVGLPGNFHHVMYCLPPNVLNGLAYAYINYWMSVYNDAWCDKPSVHNHEIGHNVGLGHSGIEGGIGNDASYGDTSCTMGYSSYVDEGPQRCFNAAKSWQLGWYEDRHVTVAPLAAGGYFSWTGRLMGFADYKNAAAYAVILKIVTNQAMDYYVNFNRQVGFNIETGRDGDKVMITKQGKNLGDLSSLVSTLDTGGTFSIANFGGSGWPLTITVNQINKSTSLYYADITVTYTGPPISLFTTVAQNNGNAGNMFDIKAKKDISIMGFDLHLNATGINYNAKVFTKTGSCSGSETNSLAWGAPILDVPVSNSEVRGLNSLTPLPLLGSPIAMSAGSTRAFYVTLTTTGMRYTNGNSATASSPYVEDANLQIFQGTGNTYPFNKTNFPRIWNGAIKYASAPTLSLFTTLAQNNGNAGNMFDVKAKTNLRIIGFDLHLNNTGINYNVKVFTKTGSYGGFETNSLVWGTPILDVPVSNSEVRGVGNLTSLPLLGSPITMSAGSTRAFYITLTTTGMRYTNGNTATASSPYTEDLNLQIFQGTGNSYPFNKTTFPRVWNGVIKYYNTV